MNKKLKQLFSRGSDFLGVDLPIMGGAMTWISERNLEGCPKVFRHDEK